MAKEKINDTFGEKIGRSRRDIWRMLHTGSPDDLDDLDEGEIGLLSKIANRDAVWPKTDWDKYEGTDFERDVEIHLLRMAMPATPAAAGKSLGLSSPMAPKEYIRAMMRMRSFVEQGIGGETLQDAATAAFGWRTGHAVHKAERSLARIMNNLSLYGFPEHRHPCLFADGVSIVKTENTFAFCDRRKSWVPMYFDTIEALRERISGKKEQKAKRKSPERPMLAAITREGPYAPADTVSPEKFQERFGFRGGEFGSWLTQEDRRQSLAWAWDSLRDLAFVLHVRENDIARNGLAFAFGARGNGGRALATYEPELNVINLTKMRGAGALAHEWAHYLDYKVLKPAGLGSETMDWLEWKSPETEKERFTAFLQSVGEKEEEKLLSWVPRDNRREEAKASLAKAENKTAYCEAMREIVGSWIDPRSGEKARNWRLFIGRLEENEPRRLEIDFHKRARELDSGKSKPYWAKREELWARTFEAYVLKKLSGLGYHNDYLVTLYEHEISPYPDDGEMSAMEKKIEAILEEVFELLPEESARVDETMHNAPAFPDIPVGEKLVQGSLFS